MTNALAWTLIHFLWEGSVIALALAVGLSVSRSARLRYGLACVALMAMLCAFGITLERLRPHAAPLVGLAILPAAGFQPAIDALPSPLPSPQKDPMRWLVPLWMIGAGLCGLRSLAGWLAAQRLRRTGVCNAPEHWQLRLRRLTDRLRVSRPIVLLESCLTEVPVAMGFLRPAILIPAGMLTGFPPEQIECFLLHELAHIRRWDYFANLLQSIAEDLLFYHPAVWWVSSIIRAERENCCDDVVAEMADGRGFAHALADLEKRRVAAQPALAANGGKLANRIRRLLGQPESRRSGVAPALLASLLAISVAVAIGTAEKPSLSALNPPPQLSLPFFANFSKDRPQPLLAQAPAPTQGARPTELPASDSDRKKNEEKLKQELESPYVKWLNQEVIYIITPAERQAFRGLQTDEERQKFVEQYWLRRDPTPGTPENEYREEHYRRIAYANENFGAGAIPGWKTDRGMIYIKYGPPDFMLHEQIGVPAAEHWRYQYIDGIGANVNILFVDSSGTGDYHMTVDPAQAALIRPQAASAPTGGAVSVVSPTDGTVIALYVGQGQSVRRGDALLEIENKGGSRRTTISPIDGAILMYPATSVGAQVRQGQHLLTIASGGFEADVKKAMFQAGYEASARDIPDGISFNDNNPATKELRDAVRDLDRLVKQSRYVPTPETRAALERLQTLVGSLRAQRLGAQK